MAEMQRAGLRRVIVAGAVGNIMEWYDFAVYGFFAATLGQQFFPAEDPAVGLIAAFGAFAVGFLMRPFGGVLFGFIGDRLGRPAALLWSVAAMAVPTFLMGLLPTYAAIGIAAPMLMVLLRAIQGLAVGGEFSSSVVFLAEAAPAKARGFIGSWAVWGAVAGTLLGSAVGALMTSVFSAEQIEAWGWRVPFLLGVVVGGAGLYLRRHLAVEAPEAKAPGFPLAVAVREHPAGVAQVIGVSLANAIGFYMIFVYAVVYLKEVVHVSAAAALDINTLNMVILLIVVPIAGWLSDRFGRKPVLFVASGGLLLLAWPLFDLMHSGSEAQIFLGQLGFAVLIGAFSVNPVAALELFPRGVRCTASATAYNLTLGLLAARRRWSQPI